MAGSIAASEDATHFLHKDTLHANNTLGNSASPGQALSDADSDAHRKRMSQEIKKAFDDYLYNNPNVVSNNSGGLLGSLLAGNNQA